MSVSFQKSYDPPFYNLVLCARYLRPLAADSSCRHSGRPFRRGQAQLPRVELVEAHLHKVVQTLNSKVTITPFPESKPSVPSSFGSAVDVKK